MTLVEGDRALRSDARRNLEQIVVAARTVFAEQGLDASVASIAERTGVGTATIFRRFPTKDDLVGAVVEHRLRGLAESARLAAASDDPGEALRGFMATAVAGFVGDRCFCEAAGSSSFARAEVSALAEELRLSVAELVRRAQAAGMLRTDVTAEDVRVLVMAVGRAGLMLEQATPGAWRRYLDLVLDGLRPLDR
ncbi:MAG: TetR/AcrR family transcriptional regulator [Gaiellaceae bacterium]